MCLHINVVGQKMCLPSCLELVSGSQKFVKLTFDLSDEWDNLNVFAQFQQGDTAYHHYLDGDKSVFIPHEIKAGKFSLMLYGSDDTIIGTTNSITFVMNENNLIENAAETEISETLYKKLLDAVSNELVLHNTDTSAHENMRSAIYGQVANMIDMDVYEHDTDTSAHEDIRQLIDNSLEKIVLPTNIIPHLLVSSSGDNTNDILGGRVEFCFNGEQKEYYLLTLDANSFDDGIYYLQIFKDLTISDIAISKNYMSEYIVFATVTIHNHQFTSVVGNDDTSTAFHNIDSSAHEDIRQLIDNSAGKIDAESKLLTGEIFNNYTDNHALGSNSHAEGDQNTASGDNSHAEGYKNIAGGNHSHAEGCNNTINSGSTAAHAEGAQHTISSGYTHVEGYHNTVNTTGGYSHIEGRDNTADGGYQHIEGRGNRGTTNELYQHVQGKYANTTQSGFAHIVGNGTSANATSNAYALDWNGNAYYAGNVYINSVYSSGLSSMVGSPIIESGVNTISYSESGQSWDLEVNWARAGKIIFVTLGIVNVSGDPYINGRNVFSNVLPYPVKYTQYDVGKTPITNDSLDVNVEIFDSSFATYPGYKNSTDRYHLQGVSFTYMTSVF